MFPLSLALFQLIMFKINLPYTDHTLTDQPSMIIKIEVHTFELFLTVVKIHRGLMIQMRLQCHKTNRKLQVDYEWLRLIAKTQQYPSEAP